MKERGKYNKAHSLSHVFEVVVETLLGDRTLANFQFGGGIIVNVINTHLIADGETAQGGVLVSSGIVITGRNQSIAWKDMRTMTQLANFLIVMRIIIIPIQFLQFSLTAEVAS